MSKEITIVDFVELNEYGIRVEEQDLPLPLATLYFDDNGWSPDGNYDEDNIAGTWVVLDGKHEIGTYAYRSIDHCTLVKEEDFRNYLMNILKKNYIEMRPSKGVKKRTRRAKLSVGVSGGKRGGSSTFRATLPTSWIREMGLGEKTRDIKLEFDGEQIIVKSNEEEKKILEKLLKKAMEEVGKEMDRMGYIGDTDDIPEELLDYIAELAKELVTNELVSDQDNIELYYEKEEDIEYLAGELIDMIEEQIMLENYSYYSNNGRYYYYKDKKDLVNWCRTFLPSEDMSLREEYEWFMDEFGDIEITLKEYAKLTRDIDLDELKDYL